MEAKASRFLSGAMAVVLLVMLCIPAFASSGSQYEQKVGFFDWLTDQNSILPDVIGYMVGTICPKSEDGYHHSSSYLYERNDGYYKCICSYCGKQFIAYESDLKQSYDNQVSELPATGFNSDGSLFWWPTSSDINMSSLRFFDKTFSKSGAQFIDHGIFYTLENSMVTINCDIQFIAPLSATYRVVDGGMYVDVSLVSRDGVSSHETSTYSAGSAVHCLQGKVAYDKSISQRIVHSSATYAFASVKYYFPVFKVIPDTAIDTGIGGQYNITTRPTTITGGNYGIVGDDNKITTVTNNNKIVNETNNTYYNPATGETSTITDWSYDYSDRSYNVSLENGDTVSVTYGDENITIVEGDANYTIYYIVDGSGTGGETHTHEWYQTGAKQGNCLTPAQRTYTCSVCGEQYTETDPAPGHSWRAIRTVPTTYDDEGNLIQEGYTIYECERCGEQYKSTNITGPPPSGGGGSGGGSGSGSGSGSSDNIFGGIFGIFWDFCSFMFDFFSEFVLGGIKGFIANLLDAGSDFFSILNPFSWDY